MKKTTRKRKRWMSYLLCFLITFTMLPTSVFATEADSSANDTNAVAAASDEGSSETKASSDKETTNDSAKEATTENVSNETTESNENNSTSNEATEAEESSENNIAVVDEDNDDDSNAKSTAKAAGYGNLNHIDIRVDGTLTLISKVNGKEISRETINVKTSNVTGTLNGKNVTFSEKGGQGSEHEWRATGLRLNPKSDKVVIRCTLTGSTKTGQTIRVTITNTYDDEDTLRNFVRNCPAKNGYDIDYEAEDISEAFTVDKIVKKVWDDDNNSGKTRPDSVTIQLYADGSAYGTPIKLTASEHWMANYTGLPKYSDGTHEIVYTVKEVSVPDGYTSSVSGMTITNTLEKKVSFDVNKVWKDSNNQDGVRPSSVTVQLYADGTAVSGKTLTLSESNNWSGKFENLPEKSAGKAITYTVKEKSVDGYTSDVTGDATKGFTITNTHETEKTSIDVNKVWKDNDNQDGVRPDSVTVQLYANGKAVDGETLTLNENNNWKGTFKDVPVNESGKKITYTVKENSVDKYTSEVTGDATKGFTITNTHEPAVITIPVKKVWDDNNNQDGLRPEEVNVKLYADGVEMPNMRMDLYESCNWQGNFNNLPVYKDGKAITYTIQEKAVTGYTTEIAGSPDQGYTITNKHTPETITVSGTKTWKDNNDQDGVRPDSITVNLLKNGDVYKTVTVTKADSWKYTFKDLPKYDGGKEIEYTVTEEAVDQYTSSVNGYDITNTHETEKTSVTVSKVWNDSDNADGARPEKVIVQLYANGTAVSGKTVTLSADNEWTATFSDLDKNKSGKEIEYTVVEEPVDGYTAEVTGNASDGYVITNTREEVTPVDPDEPEDTDTPDTTETTKKVSASKTPQTGDSNDMALWILLLLVSGSAAAGTTVYRRKVNNK